MSSLYAADVRAIWDSWREMRSSLDYMRGEQASLAMPSAVRARLEESLDEFDGLLRDLHNEILNLEDKLGMHPGAEPFDPRIVNPDPHVTMTFLCDWPRAAFLLLDDVVKDLDAEAARDPAATLAAVLAAESAANMLNAHTQMRNALDRIGGLLAAASR